jgi:MFS family permease
MFGQAVGPVIGGALTEYAGFRSIFWTLLGLATLVMILLIIFLPETLRKIAGNGSRPLYGVYKPIVQRFKGKNEIIERAQRYCPEKPTWREMLDSFRLLGENDVFVTLLFGAIIYAVWSMITSSTSTLFKKEYQLSDVMIGLIFVPNGLGCVLGSLVTGKIMDREYKKVELRYRASKGLSIDEEIGSETHPDFPLERARLGQVWWMLLLFCVSTGVYGYATEWHIAVPLIMQFIGKFCILF